MPLFRQAAYTDSPAQRARIKMSNWSVLKHRRSNVLLNQMLGARPQPMPRGLSGSQKTRQARIPYFVGVTAPRVQP